MKNIIFNKYILILLLGVFLISSESCTKDFEEINTNPQLAPELNPAYTLAWAQVSLTGHRFEGWRSNLLGSAYFSQLITTPWSDYEGCLANEGWNSAFWNTAYTKQVGNINLSIQLSTEAGNEQEAAIARIWRALIFHRISDYYGDVPYSESGLSVDEAVLTPKYDTQEFIYNDLLAELKDAASKLTPGSNSFGEGDLIFQGDHSKWIKFANALRLRLAMRMSNVNASAAQQHVGEVAGNVMESNDDSAVIPHEGDAQFDFQTNGTSAPVVAEFNGHYLSQALVDKMMDTNDPRLPYLGAATVAGDYVGLPGGTPATYPNGEVSPDNYSLPNTNTLFAMDANAVVLSYSEVQFLLAEAALKGWVSSSAEEHYNKALTASCERNNVTDAATIDAFLQGAGVAYDGANAEEQIATQLWMDLFPNGYEAWAHTRRTGYPVFSVAEATTPDAIPVRALYPQLEQVLNTTNYSAAISAQGPDVSSTKIWWDK